MEVAVAPDVDGVAAGHGQGGSEIVDEGPGEGKGAAVDRRAGREVQVVVAEEAARRVVDEA